MHKRTVNCAKVATFSSALISSFGLFICQQDYAKKLPNRFSQNSVEGGTWTRKKPLDFGGNPDHVTLGL